MARLKDEIARYEVRLVHLRGNLSGSRQRLRLVKRGLVPA
jgi:hypothetical protein